MNALRLAAAIAGVLLVAVAIARLALSRAPAHLHVDLAQPLPVATNWHAYGSALLALLLVALGIGTAAYVRALAHAGRNASSNVRRDLATIVAGSAIAMAAAWNFLPLFSSDVYAYAAYGEMARLGIDPYARAALPASNPIFAAAIWQWSNPLPVCVYGPLFVSIARAVVAAFGAFGTLAALDALRALACVALAGSALLAYAAYPGPPARRLAAAATIGLNPVAIWCAVEGHNDAIVLAVVLGGFALYRRGWLEAGALLAAFSGSLKLSGCAAGLAFVTGSWRARAGAACGVALAALVSIPLLRGAATHLAPQGRYLPQASFQALVSSLVTLFVANQRGAAILTTVIALAASAAMASFAIRLLRGGARDGWGYVALAGWLLVPNPYPWYGVWLVAVAALLPGTRVAGALLWLAFASLLRYVPDAVGVPNALGTALLGLTASLPLLWAIVPRTKGGSQSSAQRWADT